MAIPTVRALREASAERNDRYNYNGSYAVNDLDMVYRDPTTGYIYPVSRINTTNYTSLTGPYELQRFAAKYFLGQSQSAKLATDVADLNFPAATSLISRMVCASATFAPGDLVAVAPNGGNTALLNDTVIATKDPDLAVGVVVSEFSTATTAVDCLLRSPLGLLSFGASGLRMGKLTETIAFNSAGFGSLSGAGPFTQTYTYTQKLPPGALVLGTRANVNTVFAGTSFSAATFIAGWAGHTNAFAAQAIDVFTAAASLSSLSTAAGPQVTAETAPILTFTFTGGTGVTTAGNVTVSIIYIAPEGP